MYDYLTLFSFLFLLYFISFYITCFFYEGTRPDSLFCNTTSSTPLDGDRVKEVNSFSSMVTHTQLLEC